MVYDKVRELAKLMQDSEEFTAYKQLKEKAFASDTTRALVKEYHTLQIKAQAALVSGQKDDECMERLQRIGGVLQLNADASEYLLAEFKLNRMLSDVYRILAEAIETDLGPLEE